MRWSLGIIVAFTVSLAMSALMGPSPVAVHMNADTAQTYLAVPHHPAPVHSQHDDADAGVSCCMLACTPAVLAVSSPTLVHLRVTERVAPTIARSAAAQRGDPPFHPPRRV